VKGCAGDPGCNDSNDSVDEKIDNFFTNTKVLIIGGICIFSCFALMVMSSMRVSHGDDDSDDEEYELTQKDHGGDYRQL
jgi:hypothetical protein